MKLRNRTKIHTFHFVLFIWERDRSSRLLFGICNVDHGDDKGDEKLDGSGGAGGGGGAAGTAEDKFDPDGID